MDVPGCPPHTEGGVLGNAQPRRSRQARVVVPDGGR